MNPDNSSTVAIVGAGPVGLTLAMALARQDIESPVFERRAPDAPAHPKRNTHSARSMKLLKFLGCRDAWAMFGLSASYPKRHGLFHAGPRGL